MWKGVDGRTRSATYTGAAASLLFTVLHTSGDEKEEGGEGSIIIEEAKE